MTESTDTLSQSLHDAELLTSYAGRFGVAIEHNVLNVVTRARELFKQGLLHGEAEAEFYQNFIALSKAVYPVTVESLRSCMIERKFRNWVFWQCDPRTPAHRILEVHRAWGFIALITLMVVQTYWVVGSFLTASIPILSDDPSVFLPAMQERAIWTVTDSTKAATEESGTPSPATTEKAKDPGSVETNPPTKQDDHDADPNAKVATSKISSELETMKRAKLDTYKWLLDIWASPGVGIAKLSNWVLKPEHRGTDESQGWLSGTVAKEALIIVQTYVLPPLYGWVGAMAYVLRRLISENQCSNVPRD